MIKEKIEASSNFIKEKGIHKVEFERLLRTKIDGLIADIKGCPLHHNIPLSVCYKTAYTLKLFNQKDVFISSFTYHYDRGGFC